MKDSLFKTIAVSTMVCLVCALCVSTAEDYLRPYRMKNAEVDKLRNILVAAGLIEPGAGLSGTQVEEMFKTNITPVVVDLETGEVVKDVPPETLDVDKDSKDPQKGIAISAAEDVARIKRRPKQAVIYEYREDGKLKTIVFPIKGSGLWSIMYGFVSLEPDYDTVAGINFYKHGETAGLGAEISNPKWQALWENKKLFDDDGNLVIDVVRNGAVSEDPEKAVHQIDGIAGSTLTSRGVSNTVHYWLGENGYGHYIDAQKAKNQNK